VLATVLLAGCQTAPEENVAQNETPSVAIDSMNLEPDDVAADIEAGTGYFTFRIGCRKAGGLDIQQDRPKEPPPAEEPMSGIMGSADRRIGGLGDWVPPRIDVRDRR
jgi:hypothetical protein